MPEQKRITIDLCYNRVIEELTAQGKIKTLTKDLQALKTNSQKVLFVYETMIKLNAFPNPLEVKKNCAVSTYFRNLGNQYFKRAQDFEAWQYYNISLLYAPANTVSYSTSVANRSAVLFSLKKYKECLIDTKEVLLNCPNEIQEKLMKRSIKCEQLLLKDCSPESNKHLDDILTLQGLRNTKYVCASSKIEVVNNKEMGRHVIAKEDIRVGDILAQEDPYFTLLLKSQYLFSCGYCLSRHPNLYPCDHCCYVLYCSNECKNNAWKMYHSVECNLMPSLLDLQFTKLEWLSLRTVIKARYDHTDWCALFKTIEEAESLNDTEYQGHVKIDDKWIYSSQYYSSIHTLASNVDQRNNADIFQKSVTASVFLHLLLKKTQFLCGNNHNENKKILECAARLLLHHGMTSPTNMHNISSNAQNVDGDYVAEISLASAPYAFLSLLNHSCAPNVVRFSKMGSGQMTLFALRPIKKGMQLFDNYGSHHAVHSRTERQSSLKYQYKFTCTCEACMFDWPLYPNLRNNSNLPRNVRKYIEELLNLVTIEQLKKGDEKVALNLYKSLCDLAEILEPYAPCIELADCQEAIKQCLVIFEGCVPYGYTKLIEWHATPPEVK